MEKSIGRKRKREKARKETNGNEKERDRANYRERRIPRNVGLHIGESLKGWVLAKNLR